MSLESEQDSELTARELADKIDTEYTDDVLGEVVGVKSRTEIDECPRCGREVNYGLFSVKPYCPIHDTWLGKLRLKLGVVQDIPDE